MKFLGYYLLSLNQNGNRKIYNSVYFLYFHSYSLSRIEHFYALQNLIQKFYNFFYIIVRINFYRILIFQQRMKVKKVNKSLVIEQSPVVEKKSKPPAAKPLPKINLKNIIEVTEENDTNPIPNLNENSKEQRQLIQPHQLKQNCFGRYVKCLANLWRFICKKSAPLQIDAEDSDIADLIEKMKNKKYNYSPLLPALKQIKKSLVLDLDETLIHTTFNKPPKYDFESQVLFNGKTTKIYTIKRFGLDAFLFQMSKLYEIIIFTASQRVYADKIIDLIDPKRLRISHRLYRQHCVIINKKYYLKNIRTLGRNLSETIIVDDNNISGLLQPQNFYKIDPFDGNEKDRQLYRLSAFLKFLSQRPKFNNIHNELQQFENMEINVSQSDQASTKSSISEGRSLAQRKRQYSHKKKNSQVQALVTKSNEDDNDGEITASDLIKKI